MIKWVIPDAIHLRHLNFWLANHLEYLREGTEICAIYGVLKDTIWSGGRVTVFEIEGSNVQEIEDIVSRFHQKNIQYRFVFSRKSITEEQLHDYWGNVQLKIANKYNCGVILTSDLLKKYIEENYPNIEIISSTTKMLNEEQLLSELSKNFDTIVLNTQFNRNYDFIPEENRHLIEIEVNDCCPPFCIRRAFCYGLSSQFNLGLVDSPVSLCTNKKKFNISQDSHNAWERQHKLESFLEHYTWEEIVQANKNGFNQFKLSGREADLFYNVLQIQKYLIKPERSLEFVAKVVEEIGLVKYLDPPNFVSERYKKSV